MQRTRTVLILTVGLSLATAGFARACPFCDGPVQTLSERYQDAHVVVVAKCLPAKSGEESSIEFEILVVDRDANNEFQPGDKIVLEESSTPGKEVLLFGVRAKIDDVESVRWGEFLEADAAVLEYVRKAPKKDAQDRLPYFKTFLGHVNFTISNDAWGEFANAPYEEIVPVAKTFDPKPLRKWLDMPKRAAHYSLYGMMLGLCGQKGDMLELERRSLALEGPDSVSQGMDGITGGYLLLAGEPGLAKLEKAVLHNPEASQYAVLDRLRAVRFMWTYGAGKIPPERLKQSLRKLVDRTDVASNVIPDLARWKDWSVMDQLVAMYGTKDFSDSSQKRTVILYLLACTRDVPKGAKPTELAITARKHIEALQKRDTKFVDSVLKFNDPR